MPTPNDPTRLPAAVLASILAGGACLAGACDQYQRFGKGDDSYGPVDPSTFPPPNLGTRGDRLRPGLGTFTAAKAWRAGEMAPYFAYPVPASMLAAGGNPLLLKINGAANPRLTPSSAYAFEANCKAPAGYKWDEESRQRDGVRLDEQGHIFPALPRATFTPGMDVLATLTYVPVVNEVAASAAGQPCQSLKSEEALKKAKLAGKPSGRLFAWLVIDPAAAVYGVGQNAGNSGGNLLQKWGWYNRYLVAYLDGGEIPLQPERTVMVGMMEQTQVLMQPRRLYYPRSQVSFTVENPDDGTRALTPPVAGRVSGGYDIVATARGDEGYSPICQTYSYDLGAPAVPSDDMSPDGYMGLRIPNDAAEVEKVFGTPEMPLIPPMERGLRPGTPAYVYCLQVQ